MNHDGATGPLGLDGLRPSSVGGSADEFLYGAMGLIVAVPMGKAADNHVGRCLAIRLRTEDTSKLAFPRNLHGIEHD